MNKPKLRKLQVRNVTRAEKASKSIEKQIQRGVLLVELPIFLQGEGEEKYGQRLGQRQSTSVAVAKRRKSTWLISRWSSADTGNDRTRENGVSLIDLLNTKKKKRPVPLARYLARSRNFSLKFCFATERNIVTSFAFGECEKTTVGAGRPGNRSAISAPRLNRRSRYGHAS